MKKTFLFFSACFLLMGLGNNAQAQLRSSIASFSPSNSIIGTASRFGNHDNQWSTFYMRDNDHSYFYSIRYNFSLLYYPSPLSIRTQLPQDFIVTDMKKFITYHGFIGSYQDVGMHGWTEYYTSTVSNNSFHVFKLPAVNVLERIAIKKKDWFQGKAFAIGNKTRANNIKQSYILEFYAYMDGLFDPYYYTPMPYDDITGEQEIADDVIIIDKKVVFATRDTRREHATINLRIADTNNALTNGDLNKQYQIWLPSDQKLLSELRLLNLDYKDFFILAYIVYDSRNDIHYLCTNRIRLNDLLSFNNTIVSHRIKISGECTNLIDMIYDPNVNTMVLLLNGDLNSELYHADPYLNTSYNIIKLDYPYGRLHSIDTIGGLPIHNNNDIYVAMGDSVFFSQDLNDLDNTCLTKSIELMILQDTPKIDKNEDPLHGHSDNKEYEPLRNEGIYFYGVRTCRIIDPEELIFDK